MLKWWPCTSEPSGATAHCLHACRQHAQPSWSQRGGKKWNWDCERVVCFPTSLDARRLNLPAIWGGGDPQGRRREGNGGGCFLCSLSMATHWEIRENRQESCYSQLGLRTLQKEKTLLMNNALRTAEMMRLVSARSPVQILWCLIAQLCSSCRFHTWGDVVRFSPCSTLIERHMEHSGFIHLGANLCVSFVKNEKCVRDNLTATETCQGPMQRALPRH